MTWYRYHHLRPLWLFCGDPDNDGVTQSQSRRQTKKHTGPRGHERKHRQRTRISRGFVVVLFFVYTGWVSPITGGGGRTPHPSSHGIFLLLLLSDDNNCPELVRGCAGIARDCERCLLALTGSQWPSCCSQLSSLSLDSGRLGPGQAAKQQVYRELRPLRLALGLQS